MQHFEFTKWLKSIVIIAAIFALSLFLIVIPQIADNIVDANPEYSNMYWPCLIFVWLSAIPFIGILLKAWKIFRNIEIDNSFSEDNSMLLKDIGVYSLIECIWYFTGAMVLALMKILSAGMLIVIGIVIILGFFGAVCSAALSRLVLKASKLQDDNDLTI